VTGCGITIGETATFNYVPRRRCPITLEFSCTGIPKLNLLRSLNWKGQTNSMASIDHLALPLCGYMRTKCTQHLHETLTPYTLILHTHSKCDNRHADTLQGQNFNVDLMCSLLPKGKHEEMYQSVTLYMKAQNVAKGILNVLYYSHRALSSIKHKTFN
jgi:hypothetical protein